MLKSIVGNRNKSYNPGEGLGEAIKGKVWQESTFWKADFWEKKLINGKS